MNYSPVLSVQEVTQYVKSVFSEADVYNWTLEEVGQGTVTLTMQTGKRDIRPGGTVSGPTMFALADIAAYILVLSHVGKQALAVTTNLNINFVNKPLPGTLRAEARFLKLGRRLAVCDIHNILSRGSQAV